MAATGTDKTIHFGAGEYLFVTCPARLHSQVRLVGEGWYATFLVRGSRCAGDFIAGTGVGLYVSDLAIWAAQGTTGGTALHLIASNALGPGGKHVIQNVRVLEGARQCSGKAPNYICPFGTFAMGVNLDGAERTFPPIGIRAVHMQNVLVWSTTYRAVQWWNCEACEWYGGGVFKGAGTQQDVYVEGSLSKGNRIDADVSPLYAAPDAMRGPGR